MNTNEVLTTWAVLSLDEIAARLESGEDLPAAEQVFGPDEASELRAAAPAAVRGPVGARERIVLLPGIMGSLLASIRGITGLLWLNPTVLLSGQANLLELNHDGTADLDPRVEVVPTALERICYLKAGLVLRREAELYEFAYDWRRPIQHSAGVLAAALARWGAEEPQRRFTLVGHSMGGLVARAFLALHPQVAEQHVRRVVSLGTPYFGAANAIENIVAGNSMLQIAEMLHDNNHARRLMLNLPSLYQILPAPRDLFPSMRDYPANWDLYDAAEWRWDGIRPDLLAAGRAFHELLAGADPQVETVQIAGCHMQTNVAVARSLDESDRMQYDFVQVEEGPDSGDATVPLWSAVLPGARMYYIQEQHRHLPANREVLSAVLELAHDGSPDLPTQLPPRKRTGLFRQSHETVNPAVEAELLRQRVAAGTASADDLALLFFAQ